MITLHTFGPAFGLPDASPFVTKADMLLKLSGLPYRKDVANPLKAPKGKLPVIEDEGQVIADSTFIRFHLERKYGIDFDAGMPPRERGIAWAVEKLLEDNLYWIVLQSRWLDDEAFARGPSFFFRAIPWPARAVVEGMMRRKLLKSTRAQGMGRHSPDEQFALAAKTYASLSSVLADSDFLGGGRPCGGDAALFAFLLSGLCRHFDSPLRAEAERYANLVGYTERMRAAYYPELAPLG